MNKSNGSKKTYLLGKFFLTCILLFLLLFHLDLDEGRQLLSHINLFILLAAIGLHILAFLCSSFRWWLLLRHIEPNCAYRDIAPAYYLGLFSNNFLPTGFGGDVVRTAYLTARGHHANSLISSTLLDRVLGLIVLLLTGLLAMSIQDTFHLKANNILIFSFATMTVLFGVWVLFSRAYLNWLRRRSLFSRNHKRYYQFLANLFEIFHMYLKSPWLLLNGVLISLILQVLVIGVYALLGYGLNLNLSLITYFIIIPLVMLATNIPISLGGLGVREGALVTLLVSSGVNYEQGVLLSFLYLLVLWISTLPGGLLILKLPIPQRVTPSSTFPIAEI